MPQLVGVQIQSPASSNSYASRRVRWAYARDKPSGSLLSNRGRISDTRSARILSNRDNVSAIPVYHVQALSDIIELPLKRCEAREAKQTRREDAIARNYDPPLTLHHTPSLQLRNALGMQCVPLRDAPASEKMTSIFHSHCHSLHPTLMLVAHMPLVCAASASLLAKENSEFA